ncbi:hypothetical protein V5F38_14255 [Xanthobacter sp. V0B-10]|uniref:hypothetical protein n=1 Tax=Xanthobacter albus TaxID=3119929 RepID=UPI00372A64CE
MAYLVIATEDHARALYCVLRAADRAEIEARTSKDPLSVLLSYAQYNCGVRLFSEMMFSDAGELVGMCGVNPVVKFQPGEVPFPDGGGTPTGEASVWMIGSTLLDEKPIEFLRSSLDWVEDLKRIYHTLTNTVDGRNTKRIEWLRWLDFTMDPTPSPDSPPGIPFYSFTWTRKKDTEECALHPLSPP